MSQASTEKVFLKFKKSAGNFLALDILLHFLREFHCRDWKCWKSDHVHASNTCQTYSQSLLFEKQLELGVLKQRGFWYGKMWDTISIALYNWGVFERSWFLLQHGIPHFSEEMGIAHISTAHIALAFLERPFKPEEKKTNQQPGNHKQFTRQTGMPVASQAAWACLPLFRINTETAPRWTLLPLPVSNVYIKSPCLGIS